MMKQKTLSLSGRLRKTIRRCMKLIWRPYLPHRRLLERSAGAVPTQIENVDRFYGVDVAAKSDNPQTTTSPTPEEKSKVEVDEDLFGGEDLGDIDEQLGDLALEEAGMS